MYKNAKTRRRKRKFKLRHKTKRRRRRRQKRGGKRKTRQKRKHSFRRKRISGGYTPLYLGAANAGSRVAVSPDVLWQRLIDRHQYRGGEGNPTPSHIAAEHAAHAAGVHMHPKDEQWDQMFRRAEARHQRPRETRVQWAQRRAAARRQERQEQREWQGAGHSSSMLIDDGHG